MRLPGMLKPGPAWAAAGTARVVRRARAMRAVRRNGIRAWFRAARGDARRATLRSMPELRSRTVTHGRNMAGARALLRAAGVEKEDFGASRSSP